MKLAIIRQIDSQAQTMNKRIILALIILVMVGAVNLLFGESFKEHYLGQIFLGLGLVVAIYVVLFNRINRMDITEKGITVGEVFRPRQIKWEDIERILVDEHCNIRVRSNQGSLTINIAGDLAKMIARIEQYAGQKVKKTDNVYEGEMRTWHSGKIVILIAIVLLFSCIAAFLIKDLLVLVFAIFGLISGGLRMHFKVNHQMARRYDLLTSPLVAVLIGWYTSTIYQPGKPFIVAILLMVVLYFINLAVGGIVVFNLIEDKRRTGNSK